MYYFDLDESESDDDASVQVLQTFVIGHKRCGKSSLINRVRQNLFTLYYTPTKTVEIFEPVWISEKHQLQFVEIPHNYTFENNLSIVPHIIILFLPLNTQVWNNFVSNTRVLSTMEVVFVTQEKLVQKQHRLFHIDCLENTGFKKLLDFIKF